MPLSMHIPSLQASVIITDCQFPPIGHVRHLLLDVPAHAILQITVNVTFSTALSQEWKWNQNDREILGFNNSLQTVSSQPHRHGWQRQ